MKNIFVLKKGIQFIGLVPLCSLYAIIFLYYPKCGYNFDITKQWFCFSLNWQQGVGVPDTLVPSEYHVVRSKGVQHLEYHDE